jgi:hypothetical protein
MRSPRFPALELGLVMAGRRGGTAGVMRIVARDDLEHQRVISDCARHRSDMVEREGKWEDTAARDQTVGRLESDDAASTGGVSDAAAGVAPERHREQPRCQARA